MKVTCKWCSRNSGPHIGLCTINKDKGRVHKYRQGYHGQPGLWTACGYKLRGSALTEDET